MTAADRLQAAGGLNISLRLQHWKSTLRQALTPLDPTDCDLSNNVLANQTPLATP